MAELTVDRTYGGALFSAAHDVGKVSEIEEEAFAVLDVFKENGDFFKLLNFPGISMAEKKDIIKNVFSGRICEELENFLYILIDNHRIGRYEQIVKDFKKLRNEEEGVAFGTVYSAQPVSEERMASIQQKVSDLLGENVKLENEIDKTLIGGVKILIDGKIIDASLRSRLESLGNSMKM